MNKDEIFYQLQYNIYCRIQPSPRGGVGVFAIKDIPLGVDPFEGCVRPNYILFSKKELSSLHPNVQRLVQDMFVFKNGVYHVPDNGLAQIDIAYYINHSDNPNIKVVEDGHNFITTDNILAGDELVSDYASYNDQEDVFDR